MNSSGSTPWEQLGRLAPKLAQLTDDILFIAGKVRSDEVKHAFYRRLVERLRDAPGIRPEDVMVIINTTETIDWSFGSGILAPVAMSPRNQPLA